MSGKPLLEASGLDVDLGARPVLKGAAFAILPGEIVAVVGPNGAGKSTLLRTLAGLVTPRAGAITLEDRALAAWPRTELARAVSYLPQEGRVHWPLAVKAVVALGRIPFRAGFGAMAAADDAAVRDAMRAMDVEAFAERSVGTLSGGERARVLLARSLAQGARLLIADEPTAGLDPGHVIAMFEHFVRLASEGRAVVIAMHDLSAAARFCHRLVLIKDGAVIAAGAPRDVLSPRNLASAYGIVAELTEIDGIATVLARGRIDTGAATKGVA